MESGQDRDPLGRDVLPSLEEVDVLSGRPSQRQSRSQLSVDRLTAFILPVPPVRARIGAMTFHKERIEEFLRASGAEDLPHAGGSLYDHLRRVTATLATWGSGPTVQVAALCHAAYGTDGFAHPLLDVADRNTLTALIGPDAEALVYLYGSCDRSAVYAHLGDADPVPFRDRFTGEVHSPAPASLRAFVEITTANELDVLAHDAAVAAKYGTALHALFARARRRMSEPAWRACIAQFGASAGG
jgi:hypothetical protein